MVLVAVLALLAVPQLWYPYGFDQGVYAACGDVIRRGGVPIRDCFETKQAGVMVMYAIPMLFSLSPMAVHAFALLWTALTAVVIGQVAKRLFHPAAAWPAAVFYWLAYAGINYWSMDQAETFVNLFLVLALYAAWRGAGRLRVSPLPRGEGLGVRGFAWLLIGGACIGVAFWFKYVFALIGVVLAVCLVIRTWLGTRKLPAALLNGFVFGLVALGVAGLGLVYYLVANGLPALLSQFAFLRAAFPLGPPRTAPEILAQLARFLDNGADLPGGFKATVSQWVILGGGFPLFFVLAAIGAWRCAGEERARSAFVYLLAYFVTAAGIVAWQANYIQYHYTIMIPPVVLAASAADFRLPILDFRLAIARRAAPAPQSKIQNPREASKIVVLLLVLTVVLLSVRMLPWVEDWFRNVVVQGKSPRDVYLESYVAAHVPVAEYINSHTSADDTISVFGDAPWVYTLADRRNATRFSFVNLWLHKREASTYPLFTQEFYDGLVRNRPVYFILTKADFPWPDNDYIPDYKAATAIYVYVESNYAYEGENGPFLLFRRK
ncbi:MAG: hypothetical protein M1546_22405 [Chloroflexi bacterium]|nr:hypothetical protein [Chloroflexota bacterium]